jgi:hypothetical protein
MTQDRLDVLKEDGRVPSSAAPTSMKVRLTQIDGALPNLALMKLSHFHRSRGDDVHFTRSVDRDLFEPAYDRVYGSALFDFSGDRLERFKTAWPDAIIGGTGAGEHLLQFSVEQLIGSEYEYYDYSGYPTFEESIGFTQRGCRLNCGFCSVRKKEGRPRPLNTIDNIWRGEPWPKKLRLLDNDFFGQPQDQWRARIKEIRDGGFRVNITQGINIRLVNEEAAEALASIEYRDTKFERRKLYAAWDNLKDETVFFSRRGPPSARRHPTDPPTCLHAHRL